MRNIWGLWPVMPAIAATLLLALPETVDPTARSIIGALVGVGLAVAVVQAYVRSRIEPLVAVAERLAAGETGVVVPLRRDPLGRRLSNAVTSLGASMAEAQSDATTDRLTGIPNRAAIVGSLFTEVERSIRYRRPLSVAFADIDHFKTINDTFGHATGDGVLVEYAKRLLASVRSTDTVARLAGDEFVVVLENVHTREAAVAVARKIVQQIGTSAFELDGQSLRVTTSIGIAFHQPTEAAVTDAAITDADLLARADAALYRAKSAGRNTFGFSD
jgi:diguanylate cyclase (GGDEF)-like protein